MGRNRPLYMAVVREATGDELAQMHAETVGRRAVANAVLSAMEVSAQWHPDHLPVEDIAQVLWHYRDELSYYGEVEPGGFRKLLIAAIAHADYENRRLLRVPYSTLVDLVEIAELVDGGILRLRIAIGGAATCGCSTRYVRDNGGVHPADCIARST